MSVSFQAHQVDIYSYSLQQWYNIQPARVPYLLYLPPSFTVNLDDGFFGLLPELKKERIESILAYIMKKKLKNPTGTLRECTNAEFVCNRGILIDFGLGKMDFRALRHEDVIFLLQGDLESNLSTASKYLNAALYRGLKFEQLATEMYPSQRAQKKVVNRKVMKSEIKKNNKVFEMLYSGEVDAMNEENNCIEIKLTSILNKEEWWLNKSLFWYLQCYFANIDLIFVGQSEFIKYIDPFTCQTRGYNHLETWFLPIEDIRIVAERVNYWHLKSSLESVFDTLEVVKAALSDVEDGTIIRFSLDEDNKLQCDIENNCKSFLPYWFLQAFNL